MKATIKIDCDDERELLVHLSLIRKQIEKVIKKSDGYLTERVRFKDSNCYGDHTVTIDPLD